MDKHKSRFLLLKGQFKVYAPLAVGQTYIFSSCNEEDLLTREGNKRKLPEKIISAGI